jgi:hypothetical protein
MPLIHPINLCQPDTKKSCGACCGLYNRQDHSKPAIESILNLQTGLFLSLKDYNDLDNFKNLVNEKISNTKLFETIYNCEFLGFVDREKKKAGCMLHPEVTGRHDLRNHCFYGSKICADHFCPGYSCLRTSEQKAVISSVDDWYLYGLIITDIDLVKEFFKLSENIMGESIKEERLNRPAVIKTLTDFFSLKTDWKFKSGSNRLGKYYFTEAEYNIARIEYKKNWGTEPSIYDRIFVSLESEFNSKADLQEAESIIGQKIENFINAYEDEIK